MQAAVHSALEDPANRLRRPVVELERRAGQRARSAAVPRREIALVEEMREGHAEIDEAPVTGAAPDDGWLQGPLRVLQLCQHGSPGVCIGAEDRSPRNAERLLPESPSHDADGLRPDRLLQGDRHGGPQGATVPDAEELAWRRSRGPDYQGGSAHSEPQDGGRHLVAGHDE